MYYLLRSIDVVYVQKIPITYTVLAKLPTITSLLYYEKPIGINLEETNRTPRKPNYWSITLYVQFYEPLNYLKHCRMAA